jgi:hypothetical protein
MKTIAPLLQSLLDPLDYCFTDSSPHLSIDLLLHPASLHNYYPTVHRRTALLPHFPSASLLFCSLFHAYCTAPLLHSVSLHHILFFSVLLSHCTAAPRPHCPTVPSALPFRPTVPLNNCSTASLSHCFPTLLHSCLTDSLPLSH